MKHSYLYSACILFSICTGAASTAAAACMPTVEGPIAVDGMSQPYEPYSNPYNGPRPPVGEIEEEFFVSCDVSAGHYKTLLHVTMPRDPAKRSGVAIVEPWHPQDFWTIYDKARPYITRAGHTSIIIVSSNFVLTSFIKKGNPSRYASLSMPGPTTRIQGAPADSTQNEVLGQVGALIKANGIPGVRVRRAVLGGMSATAGVTRAYITYEHAQPGAKSIYDGYFPEQGGGSPIIDLDVPVIEIQGEREIVGAFERGQTKLSYRRADGPNYRLYEAPGAPHIAYRNRIEPGIPECVGHPWSDYPTEMLFGLALDHLVHWVDKGTPAPHMPRMDVDEASATVHRDQFGNALGGLRVSYLDVPTAAYHATWGFYTMTPNGPSDGMAAKCDLVGWIAPLPPETLKRLYPTHADYVSKVERDTAELVKNSMLLPSDAEELNVEARASDIP
jgi:Alpha/beta hydrolase domain